MGSDTCSPAPRARCSSCLLLLLAPQLPLLSPLTFPVLAHAPPAPARLLHAAQRRRRRGQGVRMKSRARLAAEGLPPPLCASAQVCPRRCHHALPCSPCFAHDPQRTLRGKQAGAMQQTRVILVTTCGTRRPWRAGGPASSSCASFPSSAGSSLTRDAVESLQSCSTNASMSPLDKRAGSGNNPAEQLRLALERAPALYRSEPVHAICAPNERTRLTKPGNMPARLKRADL